jgi:hypothetical protein
VNRSRVLATSDSGLKVRKAKNIMEKEANSTLIKNEEQLVPKDNSERHISVDI